jgi:hypothetical protein
VRNRCWKLEQRDRNNTCWSSGRISTRGGRNETPRSAERSVLAIVVYDFYEHCVQEPRNVGYRLENAFDSLDEAGECFLDRPAGRFFVPVRRKGESGAVLKLCSLKNGGISTVGSNSLTSLINRGSSPHGGRHTSIQKDS